MDFTGGAQQPLLVVGMGEREKSEQGVLARMEEPEGVMLSLDRDEHRPCRVKGSSCVEAQVDIEVF